CCHVRNPFQQKRIGRSGKDCALQEESHHTNRGERRTFFASKVGTTLPGVHQANNNNNPPVAEEAHRPVADAGERIRKVRFESVPPMATQPSRGGPLMKEEVSHHPSSRPSAVQKLGANDELRTPTTSRVEGNHSQPCSHTPNLECEGDAKHSSPSPEELFLVSRMSLQQKLHGHDNRQKYQPKGVCADILQEFHHTTPGVTMEHTFQCIRLAHEERLQQPLSPGHIPTRHWLVQDFKKGCRKAVKAIRETRGPRKESDHGKDKTADGSKTRSAKRRKLGHLASEGCKGLEATSGSPQQTKPQTDLRDYK
ncbi:MAG: hypothetical protein M1820_010130, partial [Bogoriella megaspora]